jgi:hypothetical protein
MPCGSSWLTMRNASPPLSKAISYAAYRSLLELFPTRSADLTGFMTDLGYDPADTSTDPSTSAGVGNLAAQDRPRLPAGKPHQVSLTTALGEPFVGEGMAELVGVEAREARLRASAAKDLADPVGSKWSGSAQPRPRECRVLMACTGAQVSVKGNGGLAAERQGPLPPALPSTSATSRSRSRSVTRRPASPARRAPVSTRNRMMAVSRRASKRAADHHAHTWPGTQYRRSGLGTQLTTGRAPRLR